MISKSSPQAAGTLQMDTICSAVPAGEAECAVVQGIHQPSTALALEIHHGRVLPGISKLLSNGKSFNEREIIPEQDWPRSRALTPQPCVLDLVKLTSTARRLVKVGV